MKRAAKLRGRSGRVRLRDVLFFTVPPMLFLTWLVGASVLDYHRLVQYDDWWTYRTRGVPDFVERRLRLARYAFDAGARRSRLSAEDPARESIRLFVDPGEWRAVTSDVAAHWGTWLNGSLASAGELLDVELRLRGDASAHWTTAKKSLSLKTERGALFKGHRRWNLTVKGVLLQHIASSLARDAGLLVPASDVVPVFLNDRFHGLHRVLGRPDEGFLRRAGRLPGNVFRGEVLMPGDRYVNQPNDLFASPHLWDRVAANDRPGAPRGALRAWLADLGGSTFEDHRRFMGWHDRDELARLLATMLVCGDPHHMSGQHNQYWYEDPATGRLHPIVWDLLIRDLETPLFDSVVNRFWLAALRDPRLFQDALALVVDWNEGERLLQCAADVGTELEERHADALYYDRCRATVVPPLYSAGIGVAALQRNLEVLGEWTRDVRVAFHAEVRSERVVLDLLADGKAACELRALSLEVPAAAGIELVADQDLDGVESAGDRRVATRTVDREGTARVELVVPETLAPGCTGDGPWFVPDPLAYRYFLRVQDADGEPIPVAAVRAELRGALSGESIEPRAWSADEAVPEARSWHPWRFERATPATVHELAGDVRLAADLEVAAGDVLVIAAGTTLSLAPDVSIVSRGRVLAEGTAARPIRIVPTDERLPWGVFALQGEGASGSRLEHVRFSGGGGALVRRVEYKGAVCVHDARDVALTGCTFEANRRCDDLLNVVAADVDVRSSVFRDANADAIDYDVSSGEIVDCRIAGSGNDGIDLMESSPRILSTVVSGSGDKGLSIGEGSAPLVFDVDVSGCARGVEVKDESAPVLLDSRFDGNELGLLQRRKSLYYAFAGRATVAGSRVARNGIDLEERDGGRTTLVGMERAASGALEPKAPGDPALRWLRRAHGLDVEPAAGGGRPERWRAVAPAEVLAQGAFLDDFVDPRDGWRPLGAVRRAAVRRGDLVADFGRGEGALGARVDWHLPADGREYALLVEVAGTGLRDARLSVAGTGEQEHAVQLSLDASGDARFVALPLPPGPYRAMALAAEAERRGELALRGWRLLAYPAARDSESP